MDHLPSGSEIVISTDKNKLDLDLVTGFIQKAYWANGKTRKDIETTINNSICFGVYIGRRQIGFARVLTDFRTIAYLMDVFIVEDYRGYGYGKKLVHEIIHHNDFKNVNRWMLTTLDMHRLYREFGFRELTSPEKMMERFREK